MVSSANKFILEDIIILCIIGFFVLEIILQYNVYKKYCKSVYFLLDILTILSLLFEIS